MEMFFSTNEKSFGIAGKGNFVLKRMNKLGKKADTFAHGVREHGTKTYLYTCIKNSKLK